MINIFSNTSSEIYKLETQIAFLSASKVKNLPDLLYSSLPPFIESSGMTFWVLCWKHHLISFKNTEFCDCS